MQKRVISGVVLILILVPLYIAGGMPFKLAISVLAVLGLKEILDLKKEMPCGIALFSTCALLILIVYEFEVHGLEVSYTVLSGLSLGLLLPTLIPYKNKEYTTDDAFKLMGILLFLGVSFQTIIGLREKNANMLNYLIIIPIITDIFAYLTGLLIGKRKIAPNISPNKTIEGSLGGTILGTIMGTIFYLNFINKEDMIKALVISFILSIVGQLGDLFFSKIKREHKIKDYSNLIPGHGGVLDRFDSLIFVILAFIIIQKFI